MRHYWEVLFSAEYFPYWEFTMLMMLCLQLSQLWRLHRIETKLEERIKNGQWSKNEIKITPIDGVTYR
jgi:hypothetical protein